MIKSLLIGLGFMLMNLYANAQEASGANEVEMADFLRESGKIYVVVGSLLLIFAGICIYLVVIDRKVSRLEKELKNKGS